MVEVANTKAKRAPGQKAPTKRVIKRTIGPCEDCQMREHLGCGFLGLKAPHKFTHVDDTLKDVGRTCPEYYARQPAVYEVWDNLQDYKRGALGNVLDLPAPLLEALRVLDGEHNMWEAKLSD